MFAGGAKIIVTPLLLTYRTGDGVENRRRVWGCAPYPPCGSATEADDFHARQRPSRKMSSGHKSINKRATWRAAGARRGEGGRGGP